MIEMYEKYLQAKYKTKTPVRHPCLDFQTPSSNFRVHSSSHVLSPDSSWTTRSATSNGLFTFRDEILCNDDDIRYP